MSNVHRVREADHRRMRPSVPHLGLPVSSYCPAPRAMRDLTHTHALLALLALSALSALFALLVSTKNSCRSSISEIDGSVWASKFGFGAEPRLAARIGPPRGARAAR